MGRPAAALAKSTWAPDKLAADAKPFSRSETEKRLVISKAVLKRALHFQDHIVSV